MKQVWKMLLAAALCLTLIVPFGALAEETDTRYGVCTADQTNVRKTVGGTIWFKVDTGHVAEITGETWVGEALWYKVNTEHPTPNGRTYVGYILSDYFREMTDDEVADYLESQTTPAPSASTSATIAPSTDDALQGDDHAEYTGTEVVGATGRILAEANFRSQPSTTSGTIITTIPQNTQVDITAIPLDGDTDGWYRVSYQGQTGYVYAELVELLTSGATPTPDPGYGTEVSDCIGEVTTDKVNFRTEPKKDTNNANVIEQLSAGTQVEVLTIPDGTTTSDWYRVRYNGTVGYIQAPFIRILSGGATPTPTPTPTPEATVVNATGMVTSDGVNFRTGAGMSYASMGKLNTGTVVQLLTIPTVIDESHWYKVFYNGTTGYIQSPYIRVLTVSESDLPDASIYGYAQLKVDSVNLRSTPGGDTVTQWKGEGTLMRITGEKVTGGNYEWYPVYYASTCSIYYVREDMVDVVMVENGVVVTPTPEPESAYGYVITTASGVNLRIQPAKESLAQVPKNTILACVGPSVSPSESGTSYTWYKVKYGGMTGYLRGDCVRVCTSTGGSIVEEVTPTPAPTDGSVIYGYIKLIKDKVNLRLEPLGNSQTQLPIDLILPMVGTTVPAGEKGQYCWYYVKTADGLFGYIRGDCATVTDDDGTEVTPTPGPTDSTGDTVLEGAKGVLLKNTNFRTKAGYDGSIITVIPADTIVDVLVVPSDTVNGWYKISYNGEQGYVLASLLLQLTSGTEVTPTPTLSAYGYVMINDDNVNFRNEPAGTTIYKQLAKGTVWPMAGVSVKKNEVTWYPINVNGQVGYVHGDYSFKLSATQEASYLAGNGVPEETPDPSTILTSYVMTTYDAVNLRVSYSLDSTKKYQVDKGTVMLFSDTKDVGTVTWYNIVYDSQSLWVHGKYVKVMTLAEYQAWVAENPDAVPDANSNLGYVKLIMDNVYIRNAAAGTAIDQLRLGTVLPYYAENIEGGSYKWYRIQTPAGEFGYIRSDMVSKCDENGDPLPTPTPNLGDLSAAPQLQQETSYTTLKLGSTGVRVTNMVQELINQGYYTGTVTSSFTSDVQTAVKLFQSVNGLTVDGVAGSTTLHALFGTKASGSGDTSNMEFSIYPVEKIDWYTGGIQEMLPRGSKFKIYDVKTGIVWWAYRQAGGAHMDIETLTAADSARLCQIYGVSDLQDIVDNNMWQRRPCLVTIGTRTFACSLDGMQHNSDGDTISNNGMDGQVCLHFTNSLGHSSGEVSTSHAEAIEYAYNNCPAGQK